MPESCCALGCTRPADWAMYDDDPLCETYACGSHVVELLQAGTVNHVWWCGEEEVAPRSDRAEQ